MNAIVYKGIFAVMPLTMSQTVYDMSSGAERATNKARLSVAGKTYTEEEMEDVATKRVMDMLGLPNADLLAIAAENPPPADWYETQEEKPF